MIGETLGQYRIVAEIGSGGMGTVYRARQVSLNRDVALKVMLQHQALDPTNLERFRREGEAIARVVHPNIIQIFDIGEESGRYYIAMEFVEGSTVSATIRKNGPYAFKDAVVICSQVASALGAIHEAEMVHRDVKPSNIIVRAGPFAKLGDFGVAGLVNQPDEERLTMSRAAVGTPHYMSPEQVKGRDALDGASDIYAMGVVLYEMLAGEHPFGDATPTEAMIQQCSESFPPIRRYRADIPDALEAVLNRCLAKGKAERYANGAELHAALEKVRLHIEMSAMQADPAIEDYRSRVTGTGFFYADSVQLAGARRVNRFKALVSEVIAQFGDVNKTRRRDLGRMYMACMSARDVYKGLEAELSDLVKRRQHHESKADAFKRESRELIGMNDVDGARERAEQESKHQRLALDYGLQADELGRQVQTRRDEYDTLRRQHTEAADELALLDAQARRAGRRVASGEKDPTLARRARAVRRGLVVALCCLFVFGLCAAGLRLGKWLVRPRPRMPDVRVAPVQVPPRPIAGPGRNTEGLVLHYTFDHDSGTEVRDDSGNGNDGYTVGTINYEKSFRGLAPRFTSKNTYIVSPSAGLNMNGWMGVTVSAWVKLAADGSRNMIMYRGGVANENAGGFALGMGGALFGSSVWNHSGLFSVVTNVFTRPYGSTIVFPSQLAHGVRPELNTWYNFVGTYDGSHVRFYIDGQLAASTTNAIARPVADMAGTKLVIGNVAILPQIAWSDYFFNGSVDEIRIYKRALTKEEVGALFEKDGGGGRSAQKKEGPVLYYSFDKDEDGAVTDISGNGHSGTVHGAKWIPGGKVGGAYDFNGVSDYIATTRAVPNVSDITIAAWIKNRDTVGPEGGRVVYTQCPNPSFVDVTHCFGFQQEHGSTRMVYVGGFQPTRNFTVSTVPVPTNVWTFVAVTRKDNAVTHYFNGRMSGQGKVANYSGRANGDIATVGARAYSGGIHQFFDGLIDELRIYNRALTKEEVGALFEKDGGGRSAGEGVLTFGGVSWTPWRTAFEVQGDKLVSLPKARPGFNYGHGGHGRGATLMSNIGSAAWKDYSAEFEFCMRGVDPAFNPYGLPLDHRAGYIRFHVADAKESWNECGTSAYTLSLGGDGSWGLSRSYNSYCNIASGWGNPQSAGSYTLAKGRGLQLDPLAGNRFRLDVLGTRIQVWVDGEQLADVLDAEMGSCIGGRTLDHGGIGFQTPWECMIWIRNFSVKLL